MMDEVRVECSNCGQRLIAPKEMFGEAVPCPQCDDILQIPEECADGQPPPVTPETRSEVPEPVDHVQAQSEASRPGFIYGRFARIAAPIALVTGFVGDVIKPLAPVAGWAFVASLIVCVGAGVYWFKVCKRSLDQQLNTGEIDDCTFCERIEGSKVAMTFVFALCIAIGTGFFAIAHMFPGNKDRGVIGSDVAFVAGVQDALFGIQSGIDDILADTDALRIDTGELVEEARADRERDVEFQQETAEALKGVSEELASASQKPALFRSPNTPAELYHNARTYIAGGDYANARRMFEQYVRKAQPFVDVHLEYANLLRIQDGHNGALATYSELKERYAEPAVQHTYISLRPKDSQLDELRALLKKHPDYAPGYQYMTKLMNPDNWHHSILENRLDARERKEWYAALEQIKALHARGHYLRYYINKSEAQQALDKTLSVLEAAPAKNFKKAPIELEFERDRDGQWTLDLNVNDNPVFLKDLQYSINGAAFKSTGREIVGPRMYVDGVVIREGENTVAAKYLHKNGDWSDVVTRVFTLAELQQTADKKDAEREKRRKERGNSLNIEIPEINF